MKISIRPHWVLEGHAEFDPLVPRLIRLLAEIEREGSLVRAARTLGLSYRHAWGMIREGSRALGAPLLAMSRGRPATLSPLGERLLWADRRATARLAPILHNLESELEAEIGSALREPGRPFRMRMSQGFAIELLHDMLMRGTEDRVDFKYCASGEALAFLARGDCEMAGFHVPVGALQAEALASCARWLSPESQTLIALCSRRQGLMAAAGNPLVISTLRDLLRPGVRFANRQEGSASRLLLERMLSREGIGAGALVSRETAEFTHSAVAACIASGLADAGFGVEPAARRFGLDFVPLVTERYFLLCANETLDSPAVARILSILASPGFRVAVGRLPGTDATLSGALVPLVEAFPELAGALPAAPVRARGTRDPFRTPD